MLLPWLLLLLLSLPWVEKLAHTLYQQQQEQPHPQPHPHR
jgi:hypothetical protein